MFGKKCGAKARTNNHQPCRQPAMKNGRCRLHGGKSTGTKSAEGMLKRKKALWKHGLASKEAIAERRKLRELISCSKMLTK